MKTHPLVLIVVIYLGLGIAVPSATALTATQKKDIKRALLSVSNPEMPARAAQLVSNAAMPDRADTAVEVVCQAIYKSRTSAPIVVAAIAKAAPDLAALVARTAALMENNQANLVIQAAIAAAPASKLEILSSVRSPANNQSTRASFDGVPTGSVIQNKSPINQFIGGAGNGQFPSTAPASGGQGTDMPYNKPRKL
jgi:hypothetical protein